MRKTKVEITLRETVIFLTLFDLLERNKIVDFFEAIINLKFEPARHPAGGNGNPGPDLVYMVYCNRFRLQTL